MDVEYIVVGAGAAGCVLAERLSRDPSCSVLLLEAGGPDRNPLLRVPKGFYFSLRSPRYTYRYRAEVGGPGGGAETWVRGRVRGGSSAINGTMYLRGSPEDYDALVRAGNPAWGWADMLAVFRSMEDHQLGSSPMRGTGGPLPVEVAKHSDAVIAAMIGAARERGIEEVADVNAAGGERIGSSPSNTRRGVRVSAARAFLHPARRRANLTVLERTRVGYLLLDGNRVVGVRARRGRSTTDHHARCEVLVSAGTIETPLLLERSGIGDGAVLRSTGVEVRVERPNVGERILEQRAITVKARLRAGLGWNAQLGTRAGQLGAGASYLATRRGPIATGAYELLAFLRVTPGEDRPDAQLLFTPLSTDASGLAIADHAGLMIQGYPLRPTTSSAVHIGGPAPDDPPVIHANFLRTDIDRRVTHQILRHLRELTATDPLARIIIAEEAPGADVTTEDQTVRYAMDTGMGIYHAVGSCAMGPDDGDVVDGHLRVRGVSGLRVVDASVFPAMPSGGTAAPTMAAAWRAADLILQDR